MFSSLLALTLLASEPTTVTVVRRTGVGSAETQALAQSTAKLLADARVPLAFDADAAALVLVKGGLPEAASCAGRKKCLAEVMRQLRVTRLVGVSVSQVGQSRSFALELYDESGGVLEQEVLVLGEWQVTAALLDAFARRVRERLGVSDAPVAVKTEPPVEVKSLTPPRIEPPPPEVRMPAPTEKKPSSIGVGLAVVAAAAVVAGAALAISGGLTHADADRVDAQGRSVHAASRALELQRGGNTQLGTAAGLGGLGLALGIGAVVAW